MVRTFGPVAHSGGGPDTRDLEKDGHTAKDETESAPEILNDKILHEAVVEATSEDAVDVFDEGEVSLVQSVLLGFMTPEESDLFAVVDEPGVLEAELALKTRLATKAQKAQAG